MLESFLRDAINRIVELAPPPTVEYDGALYSTEEFNIVDRKIKWPDCLTVSTLGGLVRMIKAEADRKLYLKVDSPIRVTAYSGYLDSAGHEYERMTPYAAQCDVPRVTIGDTMSQGRAIVELQALYDETPDRDYLLDLISSIDVSEGIKSTDNGVTQEATVRTGVVLKETQPIKPILSLMPYRTFLEVEQPVSSFLLRVDKEGGITLHEADGGAWKLEAKRSIAQWLTTALAEEIDSGKVVVTI